MKHDHLPAPPPLAQLSPHLRACQGAPARPEVRGGLLQQKRGAAQRPEPRVLQKWQPALAGQAMEGVLPTIVLNGPWSQSLKMAPLAMALNQYCQHRGWPAQVQRPRAASALPSK